MKIFVFTEKDYAAVRCCVASNIEEARMKVGISEQDQTDIEIAEFDQYVSVQSSCDGQIYSDVFDRQDKGSTPFERIQQMTRAMKKS